MRLRIKKKKKSPNTATQGIGNIFLKYDRFDRITVDSHKSCKIKERKHSGYFSLNEIENVKFPGKERSFSLPNSLARIFWFGSE